MHDETTRKVSSLAPGERARVCHINGTGEMRDRLLDMGLLPNVLVEMERPGTTKGGVQIRVQGFELELSNEEARAVLVTAPNPGES